MDAKSLDRLVEQAKKDPQFFHDLVFKPESTLRDLDYLDRSERANLVGAQPAEILGQLIGGKFNAEVKESCGWTCSDSCTWTCGTKSCSHTTGIIDERVEAA